MEVKQNRVDAFFDNLSETAQIVKTEVSDAVKASKENVSELLNDFKTSKTINDAKTKITTSIATGVCNAILFGVNAKKYIKDKFNKK